MPMKQKFIKILKALSDNTRLKILEILLLEGEMCVEDIIKKTKTTNSNISFHLTILKNAFLVKSKKKGKWVFYSINLKELQKVKNWLTKVLKSSSTNKKNIKSK